MKYLTCKKGKTMTDEKDYTKNIYFILLFFAVVLIGFLFKTLSSVFLPVVIAFILSFVLLPIIQKVTRKTKLPWVAVSLITVFLFLVAIFAFSTLIIRSLSTIIVEYPKYESKFQKMYGLIAQNFDLEFDSGKSFIENMWKHLKVREWVQKIAIFLSSGVFSFSKNIFLITILLIFLILDMRFVGKKINYAFVGKAKGKILRLSNKIVSETVHFLSIKFFISIATGFLISIACFILKVDFPIIWGFLAFIMNFIPTFGSIFSTALTTLFALVQYYPNSFYKAFIIFMIMLTVNMVLGNIVEPRIEGKHLGLSPFAILVSLTLWGWIWGFIGMLLAVPMTVIIKIVCENISYLHIFAIILGNSPSQIKKEIEASPSETTSEKDTETTK